MLELMSVAILILDMVEGLSIGFKLGLISSCQENCSQDRDMTAQMITCHNHCIISPTLEKFSLFSLIFLINYLFYPLS